MKKKSSRIIIFMAVCSFIIAILEGFFYYSTTSMYNNYPVIRTLLIFQNGIKAFLFSPNIVISEVIANLDKQPPLYRVIIAYCYAISVFVAPLCTATAVFYTVELLVKRKLKFINFRHAQHIIIFGYNENVKCLINNLENNKTKRIIHLVTGSEISKREELEYLKKEVKVHICDCFTQPEEYIRELYNELKLTKVNKVILFEEVSSNNFSLYLMLIESELIRNSNIKFYCYCEDDGVNKLIKKYYDENLNKIKESKHDLIIFSLNELKVRKMFDEHHLFEYNNESIKKSTNNDNENVSNLNIWDVHLLVIGFGAIGRQVVLQTINTGIMSSTSRIIIDVIDKNITEKMNIFANTFSQDCVDIRGNEILIKAERAEGELKIRFNQLDIRESSFKNLLNDLTSNSPFTYAAITMEKAEISAHCMMELVDFLSAKEKDEKKNQIPILIRMEVSSQVAKYLNENDGYFLKVFPMGVNKELLTLENIFDERVEEQSKKYHKIYHGIANQNITDRDREELWNRLVLWKKESNMYLTFHDKMKRMLLLYYGYCLDQEASEENFEVYYKNHRDKEINKIVISVLEKNRIFINENYPENLIQGIDNNNFIKEMAMLEHRRWCYHMTCNGWQYVKDRKNKSDKLRKSPCLSNWKILCQEEPEMCEYDLLPLRIIIEEIRETNILRNRLSEDV